MDKKRIAIITNLAWPLYNFRRTLAHELTAMGHEVVAIAQPDGTEHKLEEVNIRFIGLKHLQSTGQDPLRDFRLFRELWRIFRSEKIDFVYLYNAKPMIYGGIASTLMSISYVSTVAGLGNPFTGTGGLTRSLMLLLFKLAMWRADRVFFHNREHRDLFRKWRIVSKNKSETVAGSGVDMDRFPCAYLDKSVGPFTFLMFSRLLISKGTPLYAQAASVLKKKFPQVRFVLLGPLEDNKYSVTKEELQQWIDGGYIDYRGETSEVQPFIERAHVVVYPSYYAEGTPRALLEAASMCKALITTDNVGCHDVVKDEENGLLIPMNDVHALVEAMERMILLEDHAYRKMAHNSRNRISTYYDKKYVIDKYVSALESPQSFEYFKA